MASDAPVSFRARYGRTTTATVDIAVPGEPVRRETFLLRGFDELPVTVG